MSGRAESPPSFLRRHLASTTDDADVLVGLACDDNMWVRIETVQNPATPSWVLDLLRQAGASPDLRGTRDANPDMPADELRRLVECGPWAQRLVADHPNTSAEILEALCRHPSVRIRSSVAAHPNAAESTLAVLCADVEVTIRRRAATHAGHPVAVLALMRRAGADAQLTGITDELDDGLGRADLIALGELGPWGRFLAGRHPSCPPDLLGTVATDADWQIRSAVLDNPSTPDDVLLAVAGGDDGSVGALRALSGRDEFPERLVSLAHHPHAEVRLAVARHPMASAIVIGALAVDRVAELRRAAAAHPLMDPEALSLLVRAGSTPDLSRLAPPDPAVTPAELEILAGSGYWARQLVVRHPDAPPDLLAHLLCDEDPKLREWAAAHPNVPRPVVDLLLRAGAATDFQGIAPPDDPAMPHEELRRVAALGRYGVQIVAWHPNAPVDLGHDRR
ncbi:MAG: hypothetical protein ACR2O6_00460 [Ilumatobacteraceae bacterium]